MFENTERIESLIVKYIAEQISQEEKAELDEWIAKSKNNRELFEYCTNIESLKYDLKIIQQFDEEYGIKKLREFGIFPAPQKRKRSRGKYIVAASLLVLLGTWAYVWRNMKRGKEVARQEQTSGDFKNDVQPGGDKAILTLANGTTIVLDSAQNGTIAEQNQTKVLKLANGQIAYNHDSKISVSGTLYNTVSTPKGGQYQITLPDGTKVWLNAASSLRFPTAFSSGSRSVVLTGEAYFEVAHHAVPFQVQANGLEIKDLGTTFNINAYSDEPAASVTLVEGSAEVKMKNHTAVLKPGQQARPVDETRINVINDADVEQVLAWKNGNFHFAGSDIKTIMRQVARWYDVEIEYKGEIPHEFVANISRNVPVSKLLKLLQLTNSVHFNIDGKKITVMP